jgi:hypothetical protein
MMTAWLKTGVCLAALAAFSACSNTPPPSPGTAQETAAPGPAQDVRNALSRLAGRYEWNDDVRGYVFTDKSAIADIVGEGGDATIDELVECLDDGTPSATTVEGKRVSTGVLCREALGQIVYYESTGPNGDIAARWPGNIGPTATNEELAAAKRAWREVVTRKLYRRL